jgi:uncharacterized coiled-coil protein SlyX
MKLSEDVFELQKQIIDLKQTVLEQELEIIRLRADKRRLLNLFLDSEKRRHKNVDMP